MELLTLDCRLLFDNGLCRKKSSQGKTEVFFLLRLLAEKLERHLEGCNY